MAVKMIENSRLKKGIFYIFVLDSGITLLLILREM